MLTNNRVILNKGGSLEDLSVSLNNLFAEDASLALTSTDKLFIGSDLPFNHRYFGVGTANLTSGSVSVEIWDGSRWRSAVDVLDGTNYFQSSGIISFSVDRNSGWGFKETTEHMIGSGLETLKIYNMYWCRFSFSQNFDAGTTLSYVGHKFANDADLAGRYPDLVKSSLMNAFKTGKTNWDEQHVLAAEEIIRDLRKKKVIKSGSQILDWEIFNDAATHKVAEIIYTSYGSKYEDQRALARDNYEDAVDKVEYPVDQNVDGRLTAVTERGFSGLVRR